MYKEVTIKGLRGIKYLKIEDFQQVNLFVGRNNCGKTTILEGLFLLTGAANAELPVRINAYRDFTLIDENSWRVLFNNLDVHSYIRISGTLKNPPEERDLVIRPSTKSILSFAVREKAEKQPINMINSSGLSRVMDGLILEYSFRRGKNKEPTKVTTKVTGNGLTVETDMPTNYREIREAAFLNRKTIGLMAERFNDIQIKKGTEKIVKVLQQIEPSLSELSLGANNIIYCDIGLERLVPIHVVGNGMFRLLSIVLAISDTEDGIVLIDEVENGFFYTSQEILWDVIFEAAKEFNVQVCATAHSIECIRAFSSSYSRIGHNDNMRLYRIERKGDDFRVITYDHETLEASLESNWEVR